MRSDTRERSYNDTGIGALGTLVFGAESTVAIHALRTGAAHKTSDLIGLLGDALLMRNTLDGLTSAGVLRQEPEEMLTVDEPRLREVWATITASLFLTK